MTVVGRSPTWAASHSSGYYSDPATDFMAGEEITVDYGDGTKVTSFSSLSSIYEQSEHGTNTIANRNSFGDPDSWSRASFQRRSTFSRSKSFRNLSLNGKKVNYGTFKKLTADELDNVIDYLEKKLDEVCLQGQHDNRDIAGSTETCFEPLRRGSGSEQGSLEDPVLTMYNERQLQHRLSLVVELYQNMFVMG